MEKSRIKVSSPVELAARLISFVLIIAILYISQSLVLPILFAALIAISLYPLTRLFERLRLGKAISAMLAVLVAISVFIGILWFIVHQSIIIGQDASAITQKISPVLEEGQNWIDKNFLIEKNEVIDKIKEYSSTMIESAGGIITGTFGSIGSLLANFILVPLYSFFMLYYRDFFREFFFKVFKSSPQNKVNEVLNKTYEVIQNYCVGLITVMGIIAVLNTVGLLLMGIDYAWFFGSLASLLMLLPYIGITIGSLLPAIFAFAVKDNAWYSVGVIVWFQIVQFLEGNIITPNIVGSKVSINPLIAIIAILVGGMLFGLAGLILAIPLTATLKVIFDAIPSTEAFGFLIGEPKNEHLKYNSTQVLLKKWGIIKKVKEQEISIEQHVEANKEES